MKPSGHIDRKRRQVKGKKGKTWAKALVRPGTLKVLIKVGAVLTQMLWVIYKIINFFRE
jgi:hypothetical protein